MSNKTIKQSIRAYSLSEIYHFIEIKEYPEEFLKYLQAAPDNIKKLLIDMGLEQEYSVTNEAEIPELIHAEEKTINHEYKTKSENISPNNDARIEPITKLIKVMKAIASRRVIQLVSTIDKSDSQDDETLYANMRFGDSITVKRLVLHEMKYPSCRKHAIEYQNINVKISLPKGEFVFSTRCCPICKKLYVKKKNFQGVKDLLDRKKVDYAWIPEDE